jgi:glycosyltransferase involved in cell wall biosynthesis
VSGRAELEPPLVDVGIPAHERPAYTREALECVLAQTLRRWRTTISENGDHPDVVREALQPLLADPRVDFVERPPTVPASENWTALIQTGTAPYVALLHDDDLWDPEFLERRVDFLERHPDCAFVFSATKEVDGSGRVTRHAPFELEEGIHEPERFVPVLYNHNVIGPPSILVRRSAYEAVGPSFHKEIFPFYDYEMWLRLAVRYPAGYLRVRDCSVRIHDVRATFELRNYGASYLQILDYADELIPRELPSARIPPRLRRRRRARAHLTSALDALVEAGRRPALAHLLKAVRMHPPSVFDARFVGGLGALALGPAGPEMLRRARRFVLRRGLSLHRFR